MEGLELSMSVVRLRCADTRTTVSSNTARINFVCDPEACTTLQNNEKDGITRVNKYWSYMHSNLRTTRFCSEEFRCTTPPRRLKIGNLLNTDYPKPVNVHFTIKSYRFRLQV
jgi:hypothetical protein